MLRSVQNWLEGINGEVDVLIHSAVDYGGKSQRSLLETSLKEWDTLFAVNVRAQFILTQAILPALIKRPAGLIVGISSEVVFNAGPGRAGYAASKAASYSMLTSLAQELQHSSVRIVRLLPEAMVNTPGIRRRRSTHFDYSGYASPDSFATPIVTVVECMGSGMHGQCFVVTSNGELVALEGRSVPSQTRYPST